MEQEIFDNFNSKIVLDNINEGLFVIDKKDKIIFANKEAKKITRWPIKQLKGKNLCSLLHPEIKEKSVLKIFCPFWKDLKKKKQDPLYLTKKDNEKVPIAYTLSPFKKGTSLLGVIIIFKDISKEKALEEEKSKFISIISHELRTPLSAIKWMLDLLISPDTGRLNKKQSDFLEEIYRNAERLTRTANELIDISKINVGKITIKKEKVHITEVFKEVINEYSFFANASNVKIVHNKPPKKIILHTDLRRIKLITDNLISNAIKYTRRGSITIKYQLKDDKVIISVKDTGIGIPQREQTQIFHKFFRASNVSQLQAEGTGLGLYMVKALLKILGGDIWFRSKEDKGTIFYLQLPLNKGVSK